MLLSPMLTRMRGKGGRSREQHALPAWVFDLEFDQL